MRRHPHPHAGPVDLDLDFASLDEIADGAGYTTGVVYSHFRGKDDLFLAVLDAEARRRFPCTPS